MKCVTCTFSKPLTLKQSLEVYFLMKQRIPLRDVLFIVFSKVYGKIGYWNKPSRFMSSRCLFHQYICHIAYCNNYFIGKGINVCVRHYSKQFSRRIKFDQKMDALEFTPNICGKLKFHPKMHNLKFVSTNCGTVEFDQKMDALKFVKLNHFPKRHVSLRRRSFTSSTIKIYFYLSQN